jgi:hypothetical protein
MAYVQFRVNRILAAQWTRKKLSLRRIFIFEDENGFQYARPILVSIR